MDRTKLYFIGGILFTAILGTLSHFFYDWTGQGALIGLISPVNESTWEHMKLVFFPLLLSSSRQYPGHALHSRSLLYLYRNPGQGRISAGHRCLSGRGTDLFPFCMEKERFPRDPSVSGTDLDLHRNLCCSFLCFYFLSVRDRTVSGSVLHFPEHLVQRFLLIIGQSGERSVEDLPEGIKFLFKRKMLMYRKVIFIKDLPCLFVFL